ncbi:NF-kappa-B inhibitor beta [Pygocentrus nattereri]|uniref:NF-kappa-B inhibitor alpha n=1 Tax=Pygocentrus nattereri TaxID=42514 RepID=A0A3B4DU86_PYGNA|nr:NF-kappa-B inhibitor beta [Pygocentrus nattereri]
MEWAHQRFSQDLQSGCRKQDGRPGAEQGRSEIHPEDWCDSGLDSFLDAESESVPERPWPRGFPLDCGGATERQTGECMSLGGGERLDSAIGDSITDEAAVESLSAGMRTVLLGEAEESEGTAGGGGERAGEEEQMSEELWRTLSFVSEDGDTALHLALIHEQWGFVQYLLDLISLNRTWTPYLDIQNDLGQTALHLAVIVDRSECVCALLEAGACAKLQERGGHTPLHLAVREQRTECVRALTSCTCTSPEHLNITNYAGVSVLHLAVQKGRCDIISMLLEAGVNVNQRDQGSGRTPLHWAVESQSCAVVELLLRAGASVDQRSYAGHTPLYCALYRPNTELQALLKSAATSTQEEEEEEEYDDEEDEERESEEEEFDDVIINGQRVL